ncbi:MAG TPA: glycosyl hydrolase family 28-related protein [Prolixibacteraceae bacterium]|nr:glycosyl hydrolase family 28-related protein [Prolixibacteraceae bacterium]
MYKRAFLSLLLLASVSLVPAQGWRSALYPTDWTPGMKDAQGRFLHDFSYAGYHSGDVPLPVITANVIDVTQPPYHADPTGATDARAALQLALNDVGKAGGGVVYLPEGTYRINVSSTGNNSLRMNYSNVVLRGAGVDKTFLFNENSNVRNTNVINIRPLSGGDWSSSGTNTVTITTDLLEPTQLIPVSSVTGYKVGDWVIIRSDVTTGFMEEHQMTGLWGTSMAGPMFYRTVTGIDATTNTLKVDAPTRYFLKKRDNARVYKVNPMLKEVGLEDFSFANKQTTLAGLGDLDFSKAGTGAYEIHATNFIAFSNAVNCWMKNVNTYKPTENTGDYHLVSNAVVMNRCRFITIDSCYFQKPQYEGEGGNGYMFILGGNDCLIKNSRANHARHNFDFKSMQSNGNVILRCRGENSRLASDFHMHLSMANLFDNFTANRDFLEAKFRPWGTAPSMHGHPTTQSVFWNTIGEAYPSGRTSIVESAQYGWGYIIGTRGAASAVKTTPFAGTTSNYPYDSSPEDYKEGIDKGNTLQPQSLYEDQLRVRILRSATSVDNDLPASGTIKVYPNPSPSGILQVESLHPVDTYKLFNLSGRLMAETREKQGHRFALTISQKGFYILQMIVSGETVTHKIVVN